VARDEKKEKRVENWAPGKITAELEKTAMDRLYKAGEEVADIARRLVPVQTGKLRDSIRVTRLRGDPKLNIRVYAGSREKGGAFYAHMVEYGTVKMRAKPFLRPALNQLKGQIQEIMEKG
jgi:HK97 gp10 family phage protein